MAAVVIGAISAVLVMWSLGFVEKVLRVDDPVGAVSVHAANGLWGLLAVGIFADGTYGGVSGLVTGQTGQLIAQLINMVTVTAWSLGAGFVMFGLLKVTMGLRASREEELSGLDVPEHGTECYPEESPSTRPGRHIDSSVNSNEQGVMQMSAEVLIAAASFVGLFVLWVVVPSRLRSR